MQREIYVVEKLDAVRLWKQSHAHICWQSTSRLCYSEKSARRTRTNIGQMFAFVRFEGKATVITTINCWHFSHTHAAAIRTEWSTAFRAQHMCADLSVLLTVIATLVLVWIRAAMIIIDKWWWRWLWWRWFQWRWYWQWLKVAMTVNTQRRTTYAFHRFFTPSPTQEIVNPRNFLTKITLHRLAFTFYGDYFPHPRFVAKKIVPWAFTYLICKSTNAKYNRFSRVSLSKINIQI